MVTKENISKLKLWFLGVLLLSFSCTIQAQSTGGLRIIYGGDSTDFQSPTGYMNTAGDTIIPIDKYKFCYSPAFIYFAVVVTHDSRTIAIDTNGQELFEIYLFDNMPDNEYSQNYGDGELFRIIIDGLIGFANFKGEIVIQPQFQCADYFRDGKCRVAKKCRLILEGEHKRMESGRAYYIDVKGNFIAEAD